MKMISGEMAVDTIIGFAKQMIQKLPQWDDDVYFYDNLVKHGDTSHLLAFVENDEIVDLAHQSILFGIPAISPYFISKHHQKIVNLIHEAYGDNVIIYGEWEHLSKMGLYQSTMSSTYRDGWEYHIGHRFSPLWTFNQEMSTALRDAIEEHYLKVDLDQHPVRYELLPMKEVYSKYLYNKDLMEYVMECSPGSFSHIAGFHYFGGMDNEPQAKALVAIANDVVIGCIKYCYYEAEKAYGLCYIDVAKSYRGRGIATNMIRELSKCIDGDAPLHLSNESEMGKKCRMHEHFKAYNWPCGLYVNGPDYRYVKIA